MKRIPMIRNAGMIVLELVLLMILAIAAYCCTQEPQLSLNAQQFGLVLLKGRYRSWFLSFSDGQTVDNKGVWRSVVIDREKQSFRFGYRIIPHFTHVDMRSFEKALGIRIPPPP